MLNRQHIDNKSVKQENKKPTLLFRCIVKWFVTSFRWLEEFSQDHPIFVGWIIGMACAAIVILFSQYLSHLILSHLK